MSKKIAVIIVILFVLAAVLAYLNYNRLNQIQRELEEKKALWEDSEQLIKLQEKSVAQLEDKMKEIIEGENISQEEHLVQDKEMVWQEQLEDYQKLLQELKEKLEQVIQQNKIESLDLVQLREEKSKLEVLLKEKEAQWQTKEKESQEMIFSLKEDIQKYELDIKEVHDKIVELQRYLETEMAIRKNLEQEIVQSEENINVLKDKLALTQDDEIRVHEISQLQADKKQLEIEIEEKNSLLGKIQSEYQSLQNQMLDYEQKLSNLEGKIVITEEQKGTLDEIQSHLVQLREEKSKLEVLLKEKEAQWQTKEKESQEMIFSLKEEMQTYELNLKEIGQTMISLKEDLQEEILLKEMFQKEIDRYSSEIDQLKKEVALYQDTEHSYQDIIDQLQSGKEILQKKLEENDSGIGYQEYQNLLNQLKLYQDQMEVLKKELSIVKEQENIVSTAEFSNLQIEIKTLENLLVNKEAEWKEQNQETKEIILFLKDQLDQYQKEVEEVKIDRSLFKEEIAAQVELQQERIAQMKAREDQIAKLTSDLEVYVKKIEDYEKIIEELRMKLQQQENLSFQEQQKTLQDLRSLIEERERTQEQVNQWRIEVSRLQSEILELQEKVAVLEKKEQQYYEVKSGDCLWTIARERYNEGIAWIKIFDANQELIKNPDLIYPYQQFILPE